MECIINAIVKGTFKINDFSTKPMFDPLYWSGICHATDQQSTRL